MLELVECFNCRSDTFRAEVLVKKDVGALWSCAAEPVSNSFLLLLVRHLLLVAMHLLLEARHLFLLATRKKKRRRKPRRKRTSRRFVIDTETYSRKLCNEVLQTCSAKKLFRASKTISETWRNDAKRIVTS